MNFGTKLAVYLRKNRVSSKEFARLIGRNPVVISNYIRGAVKKPRKGAADRIVQATNGAITLRDMGYAASISK